MTLDQWCKKNRIAPYPTRERGMYIAWCREKANYAELHSLSDYNVTNVSQVGVFLAPKDVPLAGCFRVPDVCTAFWDHVSFRKHAAK